MRKGSIWQRLAIYMRPCDGRYEELTRGNIARNIADDLVAGLVMATVAIPLAIGFSMASGLRPEQGIIGVAIASLVAAAFNGSKYLMYGPTAALIPVISALMATYGHGFLILASLIAGALLLSAGFFRLGRLIEKIPHSIVVGFTVGVGLVIVFSQIGPALGLTGNTGHNIIDQLIFISANLDKAHTPAILMTLFTIVFCRAFEKIFRSIPGPVPALAFGYFGAKTVWSDKELILIGEQYGNLLNNFFVFTPPSLSQTWDAKTIWDLSYFALSFFVIAAIKSVLYGRAADRLADNKGFSFNPNNELRGQALMNMLAPLFNGFPQTGALGRTALTIRIKGRSPLSGIFKSIFIIAIIVLTAVHIEKIPVACIAGILLYVARGMVKKKEITKIIDLNNYHVILMCYTIIAVPLLGFMFGVLSAVLIYALYFRSPGQKTSEEAIIPGNDPG